MVRAPRARGWVLGAAEPENEASPTVAWSLQGHRAPVRLGDVFHDREPEARAREVVRVVRAPEPIEDARRVLSRDARTMVAHRHLALRDAHLDERAGWAPLSSVVDEIRDRARDAHLHSGDHRGR